MGLLVQHRPPSHPSWSSCPTLGSQEATAPSACNLNEERTAVLSILSSQPVTPGKAAVEEEEAQQEDQAANVLSPFPSLPLTQHEACALQLPH